MTESVKDRERLLEGTWEEIAPHVPEFEGRYLSVTVHGFPSAESGAENGDEAPVSLADFLGDYVGAGASGGRDPLSEDTGARFAAHLEGKRREGHL